MEPRLRAGMAAADDDIQHLKIRNQSVSFSSFVACALAQRPQSCWTPTFGALATYSIKKIEPWI